LIRFLEKRMRENKNLSFDQSTKLMEPTSITFSIDFFFIQLRSTFLAKHVVFSKLPLNFLLDLGPLKNFCMDIRIELFPHSFFQALFLLNKVPDRLIFDL